MRWALDQDFPEERPCRNSAILNLGKIPFQSGTSYIITDIIMHVKHLQTRDDFLDNALRPRSWDNYIGQERVKSNLKVILGAAKKRNEPPEHLLFHGSAGLGKTTLAYLISNEASKEIKVTSGPAIERPGDLAALLTNLDQGDILFIDEIHRLNRVCEEILYPSLEDFHLNLIIGKGPMARTLNLKLPKFTLIGATTKIAGISSPLRSRFGAIFQLNFYNEEEIGKIIKNSAAILGIDIEDEAIKTLSSRSRFTPRIANRLLKRSRDFAQMENKKKIDANIALKTLDSLGIDQFGLEQADRQILETIIQKFNGGPVGLQALAATVFEEEDNLLEIYEPYLLKLGFLRRTPRGRMVSEAAYQYLKKKNRLI